MGGGGIFCGTVEKTPKKYPYKVIYGSPVPCNVFFDCAKHNKAVDRCWPALPPPVDPIHSLGFHGRVQQRLQDENVISLNLSSRITRGCRENAEKITSK